MWNGWKPTHITWATATSLWNPDRMSNEKKKTTNKIETKTIFRSGNVANEHRPNKLHTIINVNALRYRIVHVFRRHRPAYFAFVRTFFSLVLKIRRSENRGTSEKEIERENSVELCNKNVDAVERAQFILIHFFCFVFVCMCVCVCRKLCCGIRYLIEENQRILSEGERWRIVQGGWKLADDIETGAWGKSVHTAKLSIMIVISLFAAVQNANNETYCHIWSAWDSCCSTWATWKTRKKWPKSWACTLCHPGNSAFLNINSAAMHAKRTDSCKMVCPLFIW